MLRKFVLPVMIIIGAFVVSFFMTASKKPPEKKTYQERIPNVSVIDVTAKDMVFPVFSSGVVEPRVEIRLISEVAGRITHVSPKWVDGGFFRKGDVLLEIEDLNYRNQLAKAEANLAQTKSTLTQEQALAYVAKRDWEKRKSKDNNSAAKALALREPQLASAMAQYQAAEADVASAKANLRKTKFKAPFDGILIKKAADIGQFITAGGALGELNSVDSVEVRIPLSASQQVLLDLPEIGEESSIDAVLTSDSDKNMSWQGKLVRTEGILDEKTKVLYGVVEVKDPYGLDRDLAEPLRLGSYVNVAIDSQRFEKVIELPRKSIRTGNRLWSVDSENKMHLLTVNYLPIRHDHLFVVDGLQGGERILAGGVADPSEGKVVNPKVVEFANSGQFSTNVGD